MSYLKPQYPLSNANGSFYPLTTADQVLLSDGTRLEKGGRVVADVSSNSEMLGGKAPSYYLSPRNLLDNSDFRNPVNQRGNVDVNTQGDYPIDRWMYDENGSGCSAGYDADNKYLYLINNATDGSWGALYHSVPSEKLNAGTYTICFHEKLIGPISMLAIADDTVTVLESAMYEPDENGLIIAQFTLSSRPSNKLLIAVYALQGVTVAFDWAALYEGEYTADNLPPYVPKGYAVELAECQRYFRLLSSYWCIGYIIVGTGYLIVESIGHMRAKPSVILKSNIGIYTTQTSWYDSSVKEIIQQDDRYWITFPWHDSITKEGFCLVNGLYALSADL